jgi:hypothetical protein
MGSTGSPSRAAFPVEAVRSSGLNRGMVASRRLNYIYVQNWKCGSSTVRSTLWAAEHEMGLAEPPEHPHRPSPKLPFMADPRRWEQVDSQFVFTIARNPYIRVLSAYLDKIKSHRDKNVWSRFAAQYGLGERSLAFREFLDIVASTPEGRMDPHWRPQSCNLVPNIIPYDFIGSLEHFETDLAYVLTQLFPGREVPITDHKPHKTDSASKLAQHYGPEEIRLVRTIYERDFVELGYGFDLDQPARREKPARPDTRLIKEWGRSWRLMREGDYAAAEQQFSYLRPWIAGPTVEEQILRCRCELRGGNRLSIEQSVRAVEQAITSGHDDWSVWKWYGLGLWRLRRWEDGLQALLAATERHTGGGTHRGRKRRLIWWLALLRASKGSVDESLAILAGTPQGDEQPRRPRMRAIRMALRRAALRVLAACARATGAARWHPDRSVGIPRAKGRPAPV